MGQMSLWKGYFGHLSPNLVTSDDAFSVYAGQKIKKEGHI
jgi:hypothetical protein